MAPSEGATRDFIPSLGPGHAKILFLMRSTRSPKEDVL